MSAKLGARVRGHIVNLALMGISLLSTLLLLELFLTYDNWHPDPSGYLTRVTLNGTAYELLDTSAAISVPRKAVLIAGDSFTAGSSCANQQSYPSVFTKAAVQGNADIHAINMGIVGSGPMDYVLRIKDYLTEMGPTAGIILTLYANDVELDCSACRHMESWTRFGSVSAADRESLKQTCASCLKVGSRQVSSEAAGEASLFRRFNWWLSERSRVYVVVREAGAKLAVAGGLLKLDWGRAAYPERWRNASGVYYKYLLGSIEMAKLEAERHQVPLMVVIYPDPMNLTESNEYVQIYRQASESLTASTGVPVYSGYDAFLGNTRAKTNMPFSLTDTHPSCEAHAIFGAWVFSTWSKLATQPSNSLRRGPVP